MIVGKLMTDATKMVEDTMVFTWQQLQVQKGEHISMAAEGACSL